MLWSIIGRIVDWMGARSRFHYIWDRNRGWVPVADNLAAQIWLSVYP